ncbi:hypothetical protein GCM10012275_56530 [Longimycelium tulufanense]|uniref:SF3 helicase domain-containing protein n=1 Tax=Longimycelium tulufanense TaxID=907463 RepID=A0A8J3FZA8_9PSEU|nr:phage/plasmid primase, P4 family [Longimycelium tulufanense]GGM78590.1 hypothetical protein GCM10012275_56530 [Longimycelium tulufanense]
MTLAELLPRFEGAEPSGDGFLAFCPAHPDKEGGRRSLRIALGEGGTVLLKCRSQDCAKKDILAAAGLRWSDLFDVEPGDLPVRPANTTTRPVSVSDQIALALYMEECAERLFTDTPEARQARAYVARRFGLDEATLRRLGIGVDPGGDAAVFPYLTDPYRAVHRLVVPFRDLAGVPRGVQGRALYEHPVRWCGAANPEDAAWQRWAWFPAETGLDTVVFCEGPGDALTVCGAGVDAVGIRGAALGNAEIVRELVEWLRRHQRRVVVLGDRDASGDAFAQRLGEAFREYDLAVFRARVPADVTDADVSGWYEARPESFAAEFYAALEAAEPIEAATGEPVTPHRYAPTDLGNAERLRDELGSTVLYVRDVGWHLWDGRVYRAGADATVRQAAHEVGRQLAVEAATATITLDNGNRVSDRGAMRHAQYSQGSRGIDAMLRELTVLPGVGCAVEDLDRHRHLLAVRNGVVDLHTGALLPHDQRYRQTQALDLDYDPDASCPRWEQFLAEVFPDQPEMPGYLQRLVGYSITGETSEQCFICCVGRGANGKSVLLSALEHVFDSITQVTPFSTFEARQSGGIPNDLAALRGSRLVLASEGTAGRAMDEAVLKRLTGQDKITARFLRKEFFSFTPTFTLWLASNYRPKFRGQDEGLWRRVKLLYFQRYFAPHERDQHLAERLRTEAPGILAWCVRGATEWYREGLREPATVTNAVREFRAQSDHLHGFFPGVLEPVPRATPRAKVRRAEVYTRYREWMDSTGRGRDAWGKQTLFEGLRERGLTEARDASGFHFLDVRWAADPELVAARHLDAVAGRATGDRDHDDEVRAYIPRQAAPSSRSEDHVRVIFEERNS